jgi:hypothetical protein
MNDAKYIELMAINFYNAAGPQVEKHNARLKAIAQRLEDDEWKPIETAPKNNGKKHLIMFGSGDGFENCQFYGYYDADQECFKVAFSEGLAYPKYYKKLLPKGPL